MSRRRKSRVAARGGLRRALLLLIGAIVWPGTPQFLAGRRALGAIAMLVTAGLWIIAIAAWFLYRPSRADVIDLATNPEALGVLRWVAVGFVAVWLLLFVDAWRLSILPSMRWWRVGIVSVCNILVVATVTSVGYSAWTTATASKEFVETVFTAVEEKPPLEGRYNILLIGSDSGKGRTGMRPDSMNVVSIDASTGAPVMISLPRNLQNVPFVEGSPMRELYPWGFNCGSECLLNAIHTTAANRTDLYPDSEDPGMDATIDAIEGVTGLTINYHIIVNMKGFSRLVDAVGGVEMDITSPIAMFGSEDAWKNEYIQPGRQRLNGKEALWYGRSRVQADDYARMGRQKCLLQAMVKQLSPQQVLLNVAEIGESSAAMLSTDIPSTELGAFGDLALLSRDHQIATLSVVPPQYSVVTPNFEQIRADIAALIAASEKRATTKTESTPTPSTPTPMAEPTQPAPSPTPTGTSNNTDDLASVC